MVSRKNLKKIAFIIGALLTVVIILGAVCLHLYKQYVHPELIKEKILTVLSEKTGGQGEIKDITLKFILHPHVVIRGGEMSIPGVLDSKFDTLIVYPKIIPLLKGDVKPYYVKLVNPKVKLLMEEGEDEIKVPAAEPMTMQGLKDKVISVLNFLDTHEKDSKIEIKNAQVSIETEKGEGIYLSSFNAKIEYPDDRLDFYLSGSSNLSGKIILNGWVNTESYDTRGSLKLIKFHPHKVINLLKPGEDFFQDSSVDLTLAFDIKEMSVFDLLLKSPNHKITLAKGDEQLVVSGDDLEVDIHADEKSLNVKLNKASLSNPGLKASGKFNLDKAENDISLSVDANNIEVEPSRKGVLITAGDNRIVDIIFRVVKGGTVPKINLTAKGNSLKNMFHKGNYTLKGSLVDGKISIPWAELDLFDVSGDALIGDGVLKGTNLNAKTGNSSGTDGTLLVGIEGDIGPLVLDMDADADLNDITPLLKKFVHDDGFQKEMSLITNLKGRAGGKLHIGEEKQSPKVSFSAGSYELTADYGRVPYPVNINGSVFNYTDKKIEFDDMSFEIGKFSSNALSGSFEWKDTRLLELKSQDMNVDLNEFYSWLTSNESLKEHLAYVESISGSVHMNPFSFSGPVLDPGNWTIETKGEAKNLTANLKGLEGAVTSDTISFTATHDEISFSETQVKTENSLVSIGLDMWDYLTSEIGLKLNFSGDIDADTTNVVSKMVKVPKQISVLGGVSISDSSVTITSQKKSGEIDKKGPAAKASTGGREYKLDINVNADSFEWSEPEEEQGELIAEEIEEHVKPRSSIFGSVSFNSDGFVYSGFNWDAVNGDVEFAGQDIDIKIKDATLCGISTPGYFEVTRPGLKLDFKPESTDEDFQKTLDCLFEKAGIITGEYDFGGSVYSNGGNGNVVQSLEGDLKLTSIDGRVLKYGGLSKFLTVLNFGEILRGEGKHFSDEGFPYKLLTASAEIKDGKMNITRAVMDGPSLKIACTGYVDLIEKTLDLELVVIPILAVDSVIDKIPLINLLFGEKSSSVPVKITGSWSDPKISEISPYTIKSGLLTIIKQTLNIPITLVKPVHSGLENEKAQEEEKKEEKKQQEQKEKQNGRQGEVQN